MVSSAVLENSSFPVLLLPRVRSLLEANCCSEEKLREVRHQHSSFKREHVKRLSSRGRRTCFCTKRAIWLNAVTFVESRNYVSHLTVNCVKELDQTCKPGSKKNLLHNHLNSQESGCFMRENPRAVFSSWFNEWIRVHVPPFLFCSSACRYKRPDALHSAQSWQLLLQVRAAKFSPFIYQCKTVFQFAIKASHLLFWWKMYSKAGTKFPFILLLLSLCSSFGGERIF